MVDTGDAEGLDRLEDVHDGLVPCRVVLRIGAAAAFLLGREAVAHWTVELSAEPGLITAHQIVPGS